MTTLADYLRIAEDIVGEAREVFISHLGAAPALFKSNGDFATEADVAIETLLRERLIAATGLPVHGEEQGGRLDPKACWVVDPIDGTSNYSSGNPNCAILVSLIMDGQPVVAVTDVPLMDMRLTGIDGGPVYLNGMALPPLGHSCDLGAQVGVGSVSSPDSQGWPTNKRLHIMSQLAASSLRTRISGSVGVDYAFVAQGIYSASISFSPHLWDNSAGVLLARCAGAEVTDELGNPWTLSAECAVAGTRQAHEIALRTMAASENGGNDAERPGAQR
ncbi:inositol monophosphatase family protein [Corynebacterium mayonis]|uniref:inositol monophosphatase family protein n=1 Tax=Corynebacterium mayonis TaxID=3062461 RepID=UPI00313FFB4C